MVTPFDAAKAKNQPFYHVVVTDSRKRQGGSSLEHRIFQPGLRGAAGWSLIASIIGSASAQQSDRVRQLVELSQASRGLRTRRSGAARRVTVGRIVTAHGIRGWLRVLSYTDPPIAWLRAPVTATRRWQRAGLRVARR
jgi:ribosomal protein S16